MACDSPLARVHNDASVLENAHAAAGWALLETAGVVAGWPRERRSTLRKVFLAAGACWDVLWEGVIAHVVFVL